MSRRKIAVEFVLTVILLFALCQGMGGKGSYCFPIDGQAAGAQENCQFWLDRIPVKVRVTDGTALLSYESEAEPAKLYVVQAEISASAPGRVQLSPLRADDYNAHAVPAEAQSSDKSIQRVCRAGEDGRLRWQLSLRPELEPATFKVEQMSLIPVEECSDYVVIVSENAGIRAVFNKHQLEACPGSMDALQNWADVLDECRTLFCTLMGGTEPGNGVTSYVFTEQFDYYALAGEPVYINEDYAAEMFDEMTAAADITQSQAFWVTLHELSHVFDGIQSETLSGAWNFEKEILADVKAALVLEQYWRQQGMKLSFADICDSFLQSYGIDNSVYSDDGAAYALVGAMQLLEGDSWMLFQNVFTELLDAEDLHEAALRFDVFWSELNRQYGGAFQELLSPGAWQAVKSYFNYDEE